MGISSNRGPWSLSADEPHPRRGEIAGLEFIAKQRPRADGGHLVASPGKGRQSAAATIATSRVENRPVIDRR